MNTRTREAQHSGILPGQQSARLQLAEVTATEIPGRGLVRLSATCTATGRTVRTVSVLGIGRRSLLQWLNRVCDCRREHITEA